MIYRERRGYVMIWILAGILICLLAVSFIVSKFDFLSPTVIVSSTFLMGTLLAGVYAKTWNLPMHLNTVFLITVCICLFFIGELFAKRCLADGENDTLSEVKLWPDQIYTIPVIVFFLLALVMLGFWYLNFQRFAEISHMINDSTDLGTMMRNVLYAGTWKHIEVGRFYSYRVMIVKALAYSSLFFAISNWINFSEYKNGIRFFILTLLYIPFIVLSGGRQQFIYLTIFGIVVFLFFYQRKNRYSPQAVLKLLGFLIISAILFFSSFWLIGVINGKIGSNTSIIRVLSHYAGTNISALDYFINQTVIPDTQYVGTMTLSNYYKKLGKLGFDLPVYYMYIYDFVHFDGITTNVYTALRRYIQDYGYVGCCIITFLIGLFYSAWYYFLKYRIRKDEAFSLLLYSALCYPIFLMFREERFINEILINSTLYMIIAYYVIYKFISNGSHKKWRLLK